MSSVLKLAPVQKRVAYDPKKGWSSAAQPETGLSARDYCDLSEEAAPDLAEQAELFCQQYGFSYISIPHADFRDSYEKGPEEFRPWLERYCQEKGLNPDADFCIVGPSLKTLESAERKTGTNQPFPDRNVDYLRIMFVALKQSNNYKNRQSLTNMSRLIDFIENDDRTIARKNYLYDPHEATGFRGHKSLWVSTVPQGKSYVGMQVLSEIKIEHEDLMDIDKLTRRFIDIERQSENVQMSSLWNIISGNRGGSTKSLNEQSDIVTRWGRLLYDRICQDAGLNVFLKPGLEGRHAAEPWHRILDQIQSSGKFFNSGRFSNLVSAICHSGVLTSRSVSKDVKARVCEMTSQPG